MRRHHREAYEDLVRRSRPVLYVPMQGSRAREVVRVVDPATETADTQYRGPFGEAVGRRFTASTADNDRISFNSDASYHPGDTFSVGGWFNRLGAGEGTGPSMIHMGAADFTVWFPPSGNTNKLTLRKSGTGDIFATDRTFATPYADGWFHAIFAKNAGTSTVCYLNGVSVSGTYTNQTIVAASSAPTFGLQSGANSLDFDGALAHWAIWSRVLTQAEVLELYRGAF